MRQRALHLLESQRAPAQDVAMPEEEETEVEAGEEGQARLGRSLQAVRLAFPPQTLEST